MLFNRSLSSHVRRNGGIFQRSFSDVSSRPVAPAAWKNRNTNTAQKTQTNDDTVYLNGLSIFSSRKDLILFLGAHKPVKIDPVLSLNHAFTGVYGLKFATQQELSDFQKYVASKPKKIGVLNSTVLQSKWFDPRRSVMASAVRVTDRTVRCQLLDKSHSYSDRFLQFFENYNLHEEGIDRVSFGQSSFAPVSAGSAHTSHYLLHFESHEEAVRAVVENQDKSMFGSRLKLDLFLC